MSRYFIEVAYKGARYSGFQKQENSNSIQAEVEKALGVFYKRPFELTGASRTDTGVHALQNYFHTDVEDGVSPVENDVYHLNAILPADIVIKKISRVKDTAHCRFDALWRQYHYYIYSKKDPFLAERAFFYPYTIDDQQLNIAAKALLDYEDFTSFSKKNSQVKHFLCRLDESKWYRENGMLIYTVKGNRFLRGMVRGLVGTMLRVGTKKLDIEGFKAIISAKDATLADFSVPAHGLFLSGIKYPEDLFI